MTEFRPRYTVYLTKTAQKDYLALKDTKLLRGINRVLEEIAEDPYQFKKLSGPLSHLRSAKTFSFRILYEIKGKELLVFVVAIHDRKDVYR